jgi:hypothetical protein
MATLSLVSRGSSQCCDYWRVSDLSVNWKTCLSILSRDAVKGFVY